MSDDEAERGRAEPIDAEFEPAERFYRRSASNGVGMGSALLIGLLSAGAGAAGGAIAPRLPEVDSILDKALPVSAATPGVANAGESDSVALDRRLDAIEQVMNTPLSDAVGPGADNSPTTQRVFALQAGLRDVETRLGQMPSTAQVGALVTEVQRLQQELPAVAAEARTAAIASRAAFAVAAASEASRSSGPFEQSYASLQALLPDNADVVALAPLARTGAPTRAELRQSFDDLDTDILRAARTSQAGAGFWGKIQSELAKFIIIRREGETNTPDGFVARAAQRMDADDLAGAVQELRRLSGPAARVATPWLEAAQRRLEIDTRLAAIRTELSRGG